MNLNQTNKELPAGSTLLHYRIVSKIGAGGMGEVYLAQDTSELGRTVALKLLSTEVAGDKDRLQRFIQEARTVSSLNHPNILTVHEFGKDESTSFMATEYVDGVTLRQHVSSRRLKLADVLDVAIQIVAALNAAHEAGVTHRDLKPENVMVRKDHIVKVLDFGLAKPSAASANQIDSEAGTKVLVHTEPGLVMGTVSYMSPEQSAGKGVDRRTDIWSFGVVLYEMIAGSVPFPGKDIHRQIIAIQEAEPTPLSQQVEGVPERLEEIVTKCLAKEKDERYQTAKDLLIDLRNLRRKLDVDAEIERTVAPNLRTTSGSASQASIQRTQTDAGATSAAEIHPTSSAEYLVTGIKQHKLALGLVVLVLVAAVVGLGFYLRAGKSDVAIKSIAVMPFVNESGNAEVEYLSDGMTETLISSLSQLPNLNVKARSSVFRYKGKETNSQTIGKELNVQAILNGRVAQRGDQLTLTLELVDAQTENVIWSGQYNRKPSDLVTLQSEIARDVSSKLKSKLSGADAAKVEKHYTANAEAYQLYLKGRFYWNKRTTDALRQAAEFYKQAIEKDPNYALAYSGLAETYVLFPAYSVASPKDSMPQAKAAATRALEIDDSLAEPHGALGRYLNYYEWDRVGAEKEFRRAIELNPNYATVHDWLGAENLALRKRFDEALVSQRRAEELDPLSLSISANVGWTLFFARRYDEAIAQFNRTLSLDPNFYVARANLCWAYSAKGMHREAIAECRKARELNDDSLIKGYLALVLARSGQRDEARNLLNELKLEATRHYVTSYGIALVHIGLNEKEEALIWLEKEVAERGYWCGVYAVAPELDDLRSDQRFKDMLKRLNLPE
jgi:eukaryotic-like serine/threonine-protein kinase